MEENKKIEKKGCLYIVSTPIGNWDDVTLRALKVLKSSDKVICEEGKVGGRLLKQYNIHQDIDLMNEQNEEEMSQELLFELEQGKKLALISDHGTPVLADPGLRLVKSAIRKNIEIVVVPGASSIMTALVQSGFSLSEFLYAGFLNRDRNIRIKEFEKLSKEKRTVVLLETPYRLLPILDAASRVMPFRNAFLGCNLTMPFETKHYGTFKDLYKKFEAMRFKGEFVIVFEGLPKDFVDDNRNWKSSSRDSRYSSKSGGYSSSKSGRYSSGGKRYSSGGKRYSSGGRDNKKRGYSGSRDNDSRKRKSSSNDKNPKRFSSSEDRNNRRSYRK